MTPQAIVWLVVGIGMVLFVAADVSLSLSRRRVGHSATEPPSGILPRAEREPEFEPDFEPEFEPEFKPEFEAIAEPIVEPEPVYTPVPAQQRNGNGSYATYALAEEERTPALTVAVVVPDAGDDAPEGVTAMPRSAASDNARPFSEGRVLHSAAEAGDGASWVFDDRSGSGGALDVPARSAFLLVLESIGTARSVGAIARAATNDPELTVRADALRALARLVEDDGAEWAGVAAGAARTVIAQRNKGEDDVACARSLLATIDVVLYEA